MITQKNLVSNEGKKTLLIFEGQYLGVVVDLLTVGDIITIEDKDNQPLVVMNILNLDTLMTADDKLKALNIEKVASLGYKENLRRYKKETSQKMEKNLAKKLGGKVTPGSGAFLFHKGDVKTEKFLAEQKYTDKLAYRLQLQVWNKIANEASACNKIPILEIVVNQTEIPLCIAFMNILDFHDITKIPDEKALLEIFYFAGIDGLNKKSVLLEYLFLKNHV